MLKKISKTSNRLSFVNFESEQIIPHGTLLDLLFLSEQGKYFCFCDSDLFLFKPLSRKQIMSYLGKTNVFSSGGRIENEDNATYAGFKGGATTKSPDGKIDLATSFFCLYLRKPIKHILNNYDVGFEQYRLDTQIPKRVLSIIDSLNLSYEMFDTGKLLSVLMHYKGYKKSFSEIDGLIHIGGMSGRYLQDLDLSKPIVLDDGDLSPINRNQENHFNQRTNYEISLKRFYGKYYYCFLNHLINRGAEPINNSKDSRINSTLERLNKHIYSVLLKARKDEQLNTILEIISQ